MNCITVGAGFLLQPTGLGVLNRLGLHEQALVRGQRIERLYGCNANGRRVMDMRYADHAPDCLGLGMTRGSLFTLMRDAWYGQSSRHREQLHAGVRVESIDAKGQHLIDSSARRYGPFDLIVVADGAHSRLREAAQIIRHHSMYAWGAVWCLLPAENWPHAGTLHQRYGGTREMIGLLPVGQRADGGGRWLTFFFSLPGDQVDTFDDEALVRMRDRIQRLWPQALPLLDDAVDSPAKLHRARYRDVVLRTPVKGRCVFIGDAAHAMSPQLGQGVNMALLDAEALADALAGTTDIAMALCDYPRLRRQHLAVYQQLSRWLTPLFQSDRTGLAHLRDACFGPLGRLPLARGQMLKILTGTKEAWWR